MEPNRLDSGVKEPGVGKARREKKRALALDRAPALQPLHAPLTPPILLRISLFPLAELPSKLLHRACTYLRETRFDVKRLLHHAYLQQKEKKLTTN